MDIRSVSKKKILLYFVTNMPFKISREKKLGSLFSIAFPIVFISFAKKKMFILVFFNLACAILPINLKNNFVGIFRQEKIAPIFKAL